MIYIIPFLQGQLRFSGNLLGAKQETDPRTTIITIGVMILLFTGIILFNKLAGGNTALRKYKRVFKRKAKELQLNNNQIKLLYKLMREQDVKKPLMILTHPANLNTLLRKAIREIKKENISSNAKQNRITHLYRIKHHLDKYQKSSQISNTQELKVGTRVLVERTDKKSYTTSVIGNYDNFFAVKLPTDSIGNQIRWKKGSSIKLVSFDNNDKEAHFITKILGIRNIGKNNSIIISHTIRTQKNIARGYQRVDVSISAYVYPVLKSYDRKNKRHIMRADRTNGRVGKLIDISSGGCAITMKAPFPENHFIEIDFDIENEKTIRLQGKILRVRIDRGRKIIHVKFTRASAKNLNVINNFIYSLG